MPSLELTRVTLLLLCGALSCSSFILPPLCTAEFSKEDMAKSLLHMISNDIGQLACLYAKLHNLSRVYFGGFFIRGHPVTMHTITYSINFFTKARPQNTHTHTKAEFAFVSASQTPIFDLGPLGSQGYTLCLECAGWSSGLVPEARRLPGSNWSFS